MNRGFEIDILYHNDQTKQNKKLEIEFDYSHLDVMPFYLVNCDGFHPVYNCGNEYTEIYLGGTTIICLLEYKDFMKKYDEHISQIK